MPTPRHVGRDPRSSDRPDHVHRAEGFAFAIDGEAAPRSMQGTVGRQRGGAAVVTEPQRPRRRDEGAGDGCRRPAVVVANVAGIKTRRSPRGARAPARDLILATLPRRAPGPSRSPSGVEGRVWLGNLILATLP